MKKGKHEKPRKTSNIVLVVLGVFVLLFVTAMIVIFCITGSVPDTLIQYTLGAGGIETIMLAGIKIVKTMKGDNKTDEEYSEEIDEP